MATPALESGRTSELVTPPTSAPSGIESKEHEASESPEAADVIHIDDPYHPLHHPDGFAPTPVPEERSRTPREGDEEPILAADEVRPDSAFMHPVVSPTFERRSSVDLEGKNRTPSANGSRSSSRPVSGLDIRRASRESNENVSTPLEDVEEYEPLFPDDGKHKVIAPTERFKQRPDLLRHKFPSEDVWEDSPNSFHLQTIVSTPDIPKAPPKENKPEKAEEETTAAGAESRGIGDQTHEKPLRPEYVKPRFPSRDIWEDAPESHNLVTTIEPSEDNTKPADVSSKPSIPPRPQKRTQSHDAGLPKSEAAHVEERKAPTIPSRPKPHVPARPAKPTSRGSTEVLTKVTSASSTGSAEESREAPREAPAPKPKPAVPARPGGSRIAALKAGFLSDLNSRLQTGPQQHKPEEKEESKPLVEKKGPLNDARKGRARGPARRKPAAAAAPAEAADTKSSTAPHVTITEAWNVWQIDADGDLLVADESKGDNKKETTETEKETETEAITAHSPPRLESPMAPPLAKNYAGESVDPTPWDETASTGTVETAVLTPSDERTKPAPSPAAIESSHTSSPILEKTVSQEAKDAHKSPAVEPASAEHEEIQPKALSPDADSDIEIETPGSPKLASEAVENVESFTGKKVPQSEVHVEEEPELEREAKQETEQETTTEA